MKFSLRGAGAVIALSVAGMLPSGSAWATCSKCAGDLDFDGVRTTVDLVLLLGSFGKVSGDDPTQACAGLLAGDHAVVDGADLGAMLALHGKCCPRVPKSKCLAAKGTVDGKVEAIVSVMRGRGRGNDAEGVSTNGVSSCVGDVNRDGIVDKGDQTQLLNSWGKVNPQSQASTQSDLNSDGVVDGLDLGMLLGNYNCRDENRPIVIKDPFYHPQPISTKCVSDLNRDGTVDAVDQRMLTSLWGKVESERQKQADFNGDGLVNGVDLAQLLAEWGSTCDSGGGIPPILVKPVDGSHQR